MVKQISLCLALTSLLVALGCTATKDPTPRREALAGQRAAAPDPRIRVLYVESGPRYEYRYLKNVLIRRKDDLVLWCLLLSAKKDFPQEHTPGTYIDDHGNARQIDSLTTFPTPEELSAFDVIIWGDVDPASTNYGMGPQALRSVRQFVQNGGALICILGNEFFPRLYAKSEKGEALGSILPFRITVPPDDVYKERTELFNFLLTDAGKDTLAFLLADDPAKNDEFWKGETLKASWDTYALPGVFWFWPIETDPARDGATVYVRHAADKPQGDGGNSPNYALFFEKKVDKGIVFVSAIDETWRWRFSTGDEPYFAPFWLKVLKHVAAK
jgi:hypothetical protein